MRYWKTLSASLLFSFCLKASVPFTYGASMGVSNNLGVGAFVKSDPNQEKFISVFKLSPHISFGLPAKRKLKILAEQKLNASWFSGRALSFSDLVFRSSLINALVWPSIRLSITPGFEIEAPISESSRKAQRMLGLGTSLALAWTKGGFSLTYKPLVNTFLYNSSTLQTKGHETRAVLKNTLLASYAFKNHALNLTFRTYHTFLRPLGSGYRVNTLGVIEYSYSLKTRFPLSFTAGISSYQPLRNEQGRLNLPFFDLITPHKNHSEISLGLELSFT